MDKNEYLDDMEDVGLQRYIVINGEGIPEKNLDAGLEAVRHLYGLAKAGALKHAVSADIQWEYNCDIKFRGSGLISFLSEYYPEYFDRHIAPDISCIDPDTEYTVSCIDIT
ncbi:MAG: hypothetical protein J5501_05340 [Ruminococcus sp.]|nr:hypothetical protein [Ruminococcus sp.]